MAGIGPTVRAIWGKIRSGSSLPGGGGEEEEEDYLSALPDDVLLLVLLRLRSAQAAARTSVLSRRWRRLWARLQRLHFLPGAGCVDRARAALAGHEAPALRVLFVDASGADPGHAAALLLLAAPRVTGWLYLTNVTPVESAAGDGGAVDLPCFEKAELILLELGYLALALTPYGDLTVVAPMLRSLSIWCCFGGRQPVANISAPALKKLLWRDMYDPNSVHLGQLADLEVLGSFIIVVYGEPDYPYNWDSVMLLQRFQKIPLLDLLISYPDDLANLQYLMGTVTSLPDTDVLQLGLSTRGHTFGHCVFHLLRISTRIRGLKLEFRGQIKFDIDETNRLPAETACTPGCVCDEHTIGKRRNSA
ncbi:hypothetical protein ACP4OV_012256 [Aristida adscensionis]